MSLFKLIGDNGLWTTLKMLGSQVFRDGLYEAAREHYIQSAYIILPERFDNSPEILRAIEEIHEYEDDPVYVQETKEHWDDVRRRLKTLSGVLKKAKDEDPEIGARNNQDSIKTRCGFSESQKEEINVVAQQHSALEVSDRWGELWKEHLDGVHKQKGDLVLTYFITYESQIDMNQARCRITEQLQSEGLIDFDSLFPNGANHAAVRRDVEAFDRFLYSKWERSLVLKDTNKEGRKREYRKFLGDRERNWGRQYLEWLSQGKAAKEVKIDM